jgi:hypothetical protein
VSFGWEYIRRQSLGAGRDRARWWRDGRLARPAGRGRPALHLFSCSLDRVNLLWRVRCAASRCVHPAGLKKSSCRPATLNTPNYQVEPQPFGLAAHSCQESLNGEDRKDSRP